MESNPANPPDALEEYRAVVARVDAFAAAVAERRSADLRCSAGCDGCCRVELEVSPVEAASVREALARMPRADREALRRRASAASSEARCAMLGDDGRCAIYEARPLVCRTQGLPLRYPPGFVPADAIGLRLGEHGDVTWCPLNFTDASPRGEDVLDAELVDRLLAVVNRRWVAGRGGDPLERRALRAIAAESA
jgi:hypothetical protein